MNKNNVKLLSYSYMPSKYNKKITKTIYRNPDSSSYCSKTEKCQIKSGKCRKTNVIYEAKIVTDNKIIIILNLD